MEDEPEDEITEPQIIEVGTRWRHRTWTARLVIVKRATTAEVVVTLPNGSEEQLTIVGFRRRYAGPVPLYDDD